MCGITAIFNIHSSAADLRQQALKMSKRIRHRGPDWSGIYQGKTAILVTHDISEAISLSDRVVVLSKRPASLKKIFPIQFSTKNHTPMQAREAPEFKDYFNAIWKELDVHVS